MFAAVLVLAGFVGCSGQSGPANGCTINRVVDGDTIRCTDGTRVRLLQIDAPEMDQGPFGRASQAFLEAIAPPGSQVRLETDIQSRDKYGRLLAYLYRPDGRMVNRLMVRQGFAVPYVLAPNVRHEESIRAAADSARQRELGLWAVEAFECPPAAYRRGECE